MPLPLTHAESLVGYHKAGNAIGMYNYARDNQITADGVDYFMMRQNPNWKRGLSAKWIAEKGLAPLRGQEPLVIEPVAFPEPLVSPVQDEPLSPYIVAPVAEPLSPYIAAPSAPVYPAGTPQVSVPAKNNILLYVGLGVAGLVAFFMMRKR